MQTFLPFANFNHSASCLDNKRLGKQRVECKQILLALGVPIGQHEPGKSRWFNHPAVRMWRGYELCLVEYSQRICICWRDRSFKDNLLPEFIAAELFLREALEMRQDEMISAPDWLGDEKLHASHRSNLLRKDAVHYGRFKWTEPDNLPYVWPV